MRDHPDARLRTYAKAHAWRVRDYRTGRTAARVGIRIGVPAAAVAGAVFGAVLGGAAVGRRRRPTAAGPGGDQKKTDRR